MSTKALRNEDSLFHLETPRLASTHARMEICFQWQKDVTYGKFNFKREGGVGWEGKSGEMNLKRQDFLLISRQATTEAAIRRNVYELLKLFSAFCTDERSKDWRFCCYL